MIGVLSDSNGDVAAFDAAYELLKAKGAKRFLFAGGKYSDVDDWVAFRKRKAREGSGYSDLDFLSDVSTWLSDGEQVERPAAFGLEAAAAEAGVDDDVTRAAEKFTRTPEKDSLHYRAQEIPRKVVDLIGDQLCCMVHDKNDLDRDDLMNASVFIHGKQAEAKVVQIGPRFFICPGQLSGAAEQTCGYLEVIEKQLRFSVFKLDGTVVIDRQPLAVDKKKTKLSVK